MTSQKSSRPKLPTNFHSKTERMNNRLISPVVAAVIYFVSGMHAAAAEPIDLSLEENIQTPAIGKRYKEKVKARMSSLRRELSKSGLAISSLRDGEVLMVTIAADKLFAPNSTDLKDSAKNLLDRFADIVRQSDDYKILVAVHTDDTGDDIYADNITCDRANAIDSYLTALSGQDSANLIPYGLGRDEMIGGNHSIKSRRTNRRAEIYIVPDEMLIKSK